MRAVRVKTFYPIWLGSRIVYIEEFKLHIFKNASNSKSGQEIFVLEREKTDVRVDIYLLHNLYFKHVISKKKEKEKICICHTQYSHFRKSEN